MTVSPALRNGNRFATDHRFVDVGESVNDHAINRNAIAGPNKHAVANCKVGHWHLFKIRGVGGRVRDARACQYRDRPSGVY